MSQLARLARVRSRLLAVAAGLAWLPPLLARLTLGVVFVLSGWGKLHDLPRVIEFFRSLGIPRPELQAPLAAGTELVCGALLLAGLLSRVAALPLVVVMIVATITAKREELAAVEGGALDYLNTVFGFIEYLYVVLLLFIAIAGPGAVAIDHLIARRIDRTGSRTAAAGAAVRDPR